jgi:hypothetical protein
MMSVLNLLTVHLTTPSITFNIMFVGYLTTLSVSTPCSIGCYDDRGMKTEKDIKGRYRVLNEVVFRHFFEGTGENQETLKSEKSITRTRFRLPLQRRVRCLNNTGPNGNDNYLNTLNTLLCPLQFTFRDTGVRFLGLKF